MGEGKGKGRMKVRPLAYRSGSIDYLGCEIMGLVLDDLTEGVLDGGIVAVDEPLFAQPHCKRGFALSKQSIFLRS